jgi:DNA-binding transcriptional LysR family regulator
MMQAGTTMAAARRLGLSQSAISRSLGNLESRLGRRLFEREGGRLRPTEEAVRLNRRLDPLFEALDRIDGPPEPVGENLRLIAPPTFAHRFLVSQIAGFLRIHPHFSVSLEVNTSDEVIRGLMENRFDLGVTGVELTRAGVALHPWRHAPAVCVLPLTHPLAACERIAPPDLEGAALIALTHRHARRAQLDKVLSAARVAPKIAIEVSTSFAAVDMAREGMGLAIVNPFPVWHFRRDDVAFRPFDAAIGYRSYFALSDQRPAPRIARAFMRHIRLHTPDDPFSRPG